jgi:hypothetical protein
VAEFWCGALKLPRPPLISVSSVKYYDDDEVQQTLSTSLYLVDTPWRAPGTVELAEDQDWPTDLSSRRMPVTIRFICGYGLSTDTPAGSVPPVVKQAIRLVIGWMYKNREPSKDEFAAVCRLLAIEGWGSYA